MRSRLLFFFLSSLTLLGQIASSTQSSGFVRRTYSELSALPSGRAAFCTDCYVGDDVCTPGGSGAYAVRVAGAWNCAAGTVPIQPGPGVVIVQPAGEPFEIGIDDSAVAFIDQAAGSPPGSCVSGFFVDTVTPELFFCVGGVYVSVGGSTPPAPSGGGATIPAGSYCFLLLQCHDPSADLGSNAFGGTIKRVWVSQVTATVNMTITSLSVITSGGGGTSSDGIAMGIYADNGSNQPGAILAQCAFADVTVGGLIKTCAAAATWTAGTKYWLAISAEAIAMTLRTYGYSRYPSWMTPARAGYCAALATGTGAGLTLPTCGAVTAGLFFLPAIIAQ